MTVFYSIVIRRIHKLAAGEDYVDVWLLHKFLFTLACAQAQIYLQKFVFAVFL